MKYIFASLAFPLALPFVVKYSFLVSQELAGY
jgi:hypothetical protein